MPRTISVEIIGDASSLERSFKRASRDAAKFDRSMDRTFRGVIAGSGAFRSLGRSVAFASSAFLGGAGFVAAITSTIKAAENSQKVLGQTRNAVQRSGLSWREYGKRIQDVSKATSQLSGFDDERLLSTFSNLVRRTGNVNEALKLNALAANVARGRNIELEQAQQLVLKASIGNVGALRRLGINLDKNATSAQALDLLQRKYAGSAAAYGKTAAGAQDRFRVAVENLQEAVGKQLLPSIANYLNKGADWLNQTKNQKQVADDVRQVLQVLKTVIDNVKGAFEGLNKITGSTTATVKLLFAAFVAFKTAKIASSIGLLASSVGRVGTNAATSTGKVRGLRGALGALPETVAITLAVDLVMSAHTTAHGLHRYSGSQGWANLWHDLGHPVRLFQNLTGRGGGGGGAAAAGGRARARGWLTGGVPLPPLGWLPSGVSVPTLTRPTLSAAQQRMIGLAGTPSLAALKAQRGYDLRAIEFLNKRFREGRVDAKKYTEQMVNLKNDLAGVNDQIRSMTKETEKAHKAAKARTATGGAAGAFAGAARGGGAPGLLPSFAVPARLQLAQARAEALGLNLRPILLRMRAAAYRALHSGRLAVQAQTDAWNAITAINDQLKQGADKAARAQRRGAMRLSRAAGAEYQFVTAAPGPRIHIEHFYSAASSPRALEQELARRAKARAHVRRGAR
jgi:hypothetical protein